MFEVQVTKFQILITWKINGHPRFHKPKSKVDLKPMDESAENQPKFMSPWSFVFVRKFPIKNQSDSIQNSFGARISIPNVLL